MVLLMKSPLEDGARGSARKNRHADKWAARGVCDRVRRINLRRERHPRLVGGTGVENAGAGGRVSRRKTGAIVLCSQLKGTSKSGCPAPRNARSAIADQRGPRAPERA